MDKNLLKNLWILAGLLLAINIGLGLIIIVIVEFLKIGSSNISNIAGLVAAMIVGQIYAKNFKEVMPKQLRLNVTIIYTVITMILELVYLYLVLGFLDALSLGILIGLSTLKSKGRSGLIFWIDFLRSIPAAALLPIFLLLLGLGEISKITLVISIFTSSKLITVKSPAAMLELKAEEITSDDLKPVALALTL